MSRSNKIIVTDFNGKFDLRDSSIDVLVVDNLIHRVDDLIVFMIECSRVLKPKGKIKITTPYYLSMQAWQDPRTKRAINESTLGVFSKKVRKDNKIDFIPNNIDLEIISANHALPKDLIGKSQEAIQFMLLHNTNTSLSLIVEMIKNE